MPLKLNAGLSRKVTDDNYGSLGASVNVEMELESSLVGEPDKLRERIRQLFNVVRSALTEELNGNSSAPLNGTGNGQPAVRPATQSQIKALHAIAKSQRLNLSQLLRERFHHDRPDDLNIKEASNLIDQLKQRRE